MTTARTQDVVFTSYIGKDYSLSLDSKLGCNLAGTPILDTIPTTPTSSKGTYIFTDNDGNTRLLCAAGTNTKASFFIDACSSVTAPVNIITCNQNGLTSKKLTSFDGSNTGQLTTTSILFNGIDYKEIIDNSSLAIQTINDTTIPSIDGRLSTNESLTALHTVQIANLAAVDVTELAKISDLEAVDLALQAVDDEIQDRLDVLEELQPNIISLPINYVKSVFADSNGRVDYIPTTISDVTSYSGWYYKNLQNQKVNWYIPPDVNMTVGDIQGLMLNFYNVAATTGLGCPFFTAYTQIDNITPNAASWYKSRKTFSVTYTDTTTINTSYALFANLKTISYDPLAYGHTKITATGIPGNDKGPFVDSEKILFFSVGTSSNSAAGLFEFIASKFTIFTTKSTQEFCFKQL